MKKQIIQRVLSLALSLLSVIGMLTVGGLGALADGETKELAFQTWNAGALAEAATATGTTNKYDYPVFTTMAATIGRRSISTANYFLYDAQVPRSLNGQPVICNGGTVFVVVRLIADEGFSEGRLCLFDLAYGVAAYGENYTTKHVITAEEYMETITQIDPEYGFEYKEFWMEVSLDGEAYDDEENRNTEMRVLSLNDQYSTTVFSIECLTGDDTVAAKYERDQLVGLHGINGTYEHITSNPDNPLCIVSYVGPDPQNPLSGRGEPYSLYNTDGLITSRGNTQTALLMEGLGATLQPGDYSYSFEQATKYSLGVNKVLYQVMDGEEELAQLLVTKAMVDATVGSDADVFETRSVPFTVDDSRAGHEITVKISLYGGTDYRLKSVSLNLMVDEDEPAPADAQAVIDAIHALEINDVVGTAAARAAYDALDTLGKAWVGSELANRLATYEKAQSDAAAVTAAIAALGSKEEISETNYAEKTEGLESAEALYQNMVKVYGTENTGKLVDAQALTDYRTAYDAAKALANRTAAVKAVEDLITAIGEVTVDNYVAKEAFIKAAEDALAKLESDYGTEAAALVSNKADLTAARTKFDEYNSKPAVTFGDINSDGGIDASDALKALQHSVKLITLSETEALAADVTADGQINASDALMILQCSVQLISEEDFPAAKQ